MNRYDILLGKKAPPLPTCNKKMILGERDSGKTWALLRIMKAYIDLGHPTFLSIIEHQRYDIRSRLGKKYYDSRNVRSGFNEERMRGRKNIFLDNVDRYLNKLIYLAPDQNVVATCDKKTLLSHLSKPPIIGRCIIDGTVWELLTVSEVLK